MRQATLISAVCNPSALSTCAMMAIYSIRALACQKAVAAFLFKKRRILVWRRQSARGVPAII